MTTSMRWWFGAFVLAVFMAGTSVGVIVDRMWLLPERSAGPRTSAGGLRPALTEERVVEMNLGRLQSLLGLQASQHEDVLTVVQGWVSRVMVIYERAVGRGRVLTEADRAELRAESDRLERELSPILLPEQRQFLTSVRRVLVVPVRRPEGRGGRLGPGRVGPGRPAGPGRE